MQSGSLVEIGALPVLGPRSNWTDPATFSSFDQGLTVYVD